MTYPNGEVPLSALVEVESGMHLEPGTAAAYRRMKSAASRDGVTLAIPRPAGAYRSLFVQGDMHRRPWLYNLDPTSTVSLAKPGYSTHGLGDRVDIVRGDAGDWAIEHALEFGFVREFGAADPRHFRFLHPTWADVDDVIPIESEEDDVMTTTLELVKTPDGTVWWCVDRVTRYAIPGGAQLATYEAHLKNLGRPTGIVEKSHAEIKAYGAAVYDNGIARIASAVDAVIADEAIQAAVAAGGVGGSDPADLRPLLEQLGRLPAEVVAELKARL